MLKSQPMVRNREIDIYKGFAMLGIILWHFEFIPTYFMIYCIPIFVFVTAALYQNRWETLTILKLWPKIIWVTAIVVFCTLVASVFHFPTFQGEPASEIQWSLWFFFMRNPWFGHLWYFLLYFQILTIFYVLGFIKRKAGRFFPNIGHWSWGIVAFLFSLAVSFFLLWKFGRGLSIQVFSWIFIVWLGLFHFDKISRFVKTRESVYLFVFILTSSVCITMFYYFGGQTLLSFLTIRTHDFIFPGIVLQFFYFVILFCGVTLLSRSTLKVNLFYPLELLGKNSLYYYVFHVFFYQGLFSCRLYNKLSYKMLALSVTVICCGILAFFFERVCRKHFSLLLVGKTVERG